MNFWRSKLWVHKKFIAIPLIIFLVVCFVGSEVQAQENVSPTSNYEFEEANCLLNFICQIEDWIAQIAFEALKSALDFVVSFFTKPFGIIETKDNNNRVKEKDVITQFRGYYEGLSFAFLTCFFVFHMIKVLATYWIDQDLQKLKRLIVRLIVTAFLCGTYFQWITKINNAVKNTLVGFTEINISVYGMLDVIFGGSLSKKAGKFIIKSEMFAKGLGLLLLAFVILFIILLVQLAIRAAEIAFLTITAPLAIATNLNEEMNFFPIWWRSFLSILITMIVQFTLLLLTISLLISMGKQGIFSTLVWCIGLMIVTLRGPSYVRDFMYSTGSAKLVTKAMSMIKK